MNPHFLEGGLAWCGAPPPTPRLSTFSSSVFQLSSFSYFLLVPRSFREVSFFSFPPFLLYPFSTLPRSPILLFFHFLSFIFLPSLPPMPHSAPFLHVSFAPFSRSPPILHFVSLPLSFRFFCSSFPPIPHSFSSVPPFPLRTFFTPSLPIFLSPFLQVFFLLLVSLLLFTSVFYIFFSFSPSSSYIFF